MLKGCVYYEHAWVNDYEADPATVNVRAGSLRWARLPQLPPFLYTTSIEKASTASTGSPVELAPQLPLTLDLNVAAPKPRVFAELHIEQGYALAISTDGRAFFAPVLGGMEHLAWAPVASLPTDDALAMRLARRAAS